MTVSLADKVVFDRPMAVGTQHNVAMVDLDVSPGSYPITVRVGEPYGVAKEGLVKVDGERWVLVMFWFDPSGVYENQKTPTITIDVFDSAPGIQ